MILTCFRWFAVILVGLLPSLILAQRAPENDYLVYVLSESADRISLVRFGPKGARIERDLSTGSMPTDIDGPHGIAISPDKKFYYVSLANGRPFGSVWKYNAADDKVLGAHRARIFSGDDGPFKGRRVSIRCKFQSARRHGAVVRFGGRHDADDGDRADTDLHHAARLALESAGYEALFGVHDGRHAGRDRYGHA